MVLGANAEVIRKEIKEQNISVAINHEWQEGMASSICTGLKALLKVAPSSAGMILMVCDQPFVTPSLLNDLIKVHRDTGNPIITCSYANTFGPPTFFHKELFNELLQLKGDTGARKMIRQYPEQVSIIPFPQGNIDIDTQSDYESIMN